MSSDTTQSEPLRARTRIRWGMFERKRADMPTPRPPLQWPVQDVTERYTNTPFAGSGCAGFGSSSPWMLAI